MPKISVCMATYNGRRYIAQQLKTILRQLEYDDELIISDDSSTDNTIEIIKSFNDGRIRLFPENKFYNPLYNIENAVKKATGDVIVLSDQDDVWLDNKLTVIRARFANKPSPVYLIALDGCVIDENERVIYDSIFKKINAGKGILKNIYDNTYMGCCLAFSKELLKLALPFPKNIRMHDMWLGLLSEIFGTVEFVPEKTIKYRKHSGSFTDFRRRFDPMKQIKRRYFLSYHLIKRFFEVRVPR